MLVARSQIPMVRGDRSMLMPTICQLPPNGTRWRACFRIVNVLIGTTKSEHAVWSAKRDVSCHRWTSGGRDSASQYLKVDLARWCIVTSSSICKADQCWTVHTRCSRSSRLLQHTLSFHVYKHILSPFTFIRHSGTWHGLPNDTLTIFLSYIISLLIINL